MISRDPAYVHYDVDSEPPSNTINNDDETPLYHNFLNACSLFCIVGTTIKLLLHHYTDLDSINIDDRSHI